MALIEPGPDAEIALQEVLGYLNFSSGGTDPKFLRNLNALFRDIQTHHGHSGGSATDVLHAWLAERLARLQAENSAFADINQAGAVIELVFDRVLGEYRRYHRDVLFHHLDRDLAQPFFVGRVFEAVLAQGPPWNDADRIVRGTIGHLNDYLGYRPVAVLETEQKIEPYEHEWVRPIPLYIAEAGVAAGRYEALVTKTLEILRATDSGLLARAWFDPTALDELALDPRAYDFDHPVNKRPNYHFGQWDPHHIDTKGRYRRFIVQQVTLEALVQRIKNAGQIPADELLFEAAAVLAGTILMASGTNGSGPDTHDSTTTLSTLLPHIAGYRDEFYQQLLGRLEGPIAARLNDEAARLRQPFGGARQHLNHELARLRAMQLQHVHLAQLFARMGYPEASTRQAETVQVPAARMLCQMYCHLTMGHRAIDGHDLSSVAGHLAQIEDQLLRGIACGALVDPWNIVGFGGNFSLFPAIENSVHDYRIDTLIELVEQIFALCARAWSEAAAQDDETLEREFSTIFDRLSRWWDKFATASVSSVKRLVGKELEVSTNLVAGALNAWHKAGAAAGDIGFWRMFVDQFDSPKAFQLVVEALMEKGDRVASMALLMQWLSQAPRIALEEGDSSFHRLSERWIRDVEQSPANGNGNDARWLLLRKFFDYLEANADEFWHVPQLDIAGLGGRGAAPPRGDAKHDEPLEEPLEDDDPEQLYSAAYDEVTYRDSTNDGVEGEMLEAGSSPTEYELEHESKRLAQRLAFLATMARLWRFAAIVWGSEVDEQAERQRTFEEWGRQASDNRAQLLKLLETVQQHQLPCPSGTHESLVEYDRRRMIKEGLMERIIATAVEMADADRFVEAVRGPTSTARSETVEILQHVLRGNAQGVRDLWPRFLEALRSRPILYVPLSKGGDPAQIVAARTTQQTLRDLLAWLPRLGLIRQTCELLHAAQNLESENPIGLGAVTEFDRLFETGYRAVVDSIVVSSESWNGPGRSRAADTQLVECLQQLTESQLKHWLQHSRTLRLSVVEKIAGEEAWRGFVRFVERYGGDIFTQKFLNLGNIRAILHQGVDNWLRRLHEDEDERPAWQLFDDLEKSLPRADAVKYLTLALEAVIEHYPEYRDFNSTTTQSDRGELFYMLVDFLRLRADYDRVAWNLRPIILAHAIVVERGRSEAAEIWRRALAERTSEAADRHLARLAELSQKYGMRLPTIYDRLAERFVRPLAIDRVRALVRPAMAQTGSGDEQTTFSLLEQEIQELAREPSGAGFDMPAWLIALEEEVSAVRAQQRQGACPDEIHQRTPHVLLTLAEVQEQLDELIEGEEDEAEE